MATEAEHREHYSQSNNGQSNMWRAWFNGIGIIVALVGLFWQPIWLGIIGGVLGIIGVSGAKATTDKTWGWITIVVGVVILILGLFGWTFAGTQF